MSRLSLNIHTSVHTVLKSESVHGFFATYAKYVIQNLEKNIS